MRHSSEVSAGVEAVYTACIRRTEEYGIPGFDPTSFVCGHPVSGMIHQACIRRDDPNFAEDGKKLREATRRELRSQTASMLTKEELVAVLARVPLQLERLPRALLQELFERQLVFDYVDIIMERPLVPLKDADYASV